MATQTFKLDSLQDVFAYQNALGLADSLDQIELDVTSSGTYFCNTKTGELFEVGATKRVGTSRKLPSAN